MRPTDRISGRFVTAIRKLRLLAATSCLLLAASRARRSFPVTCPTRPVEPRRNVRLVRHRRHASAARRTHLGRDQHGRCLRPGGFEARIVRSRLLEPLGPLLHRLRLYRLLPQTHGINFGGYSVRGIVYTPQGRRSKRPWTLTFRMSIFAGISSRTMPCSSDSRWGGGPDPGGGGGREAAAAAAAAAAAEAEEVTGEATVVGPGGPIIEETVTQGRDQASYPSSGGYCSTMFSGWGMAGVSAGVLLGLCRTRASVRGIHLRR